MTKVKKTLLAMGLVLASVIAISAPVISCGNKKESTTPERDKLRVTLDKLVTAYKSLGIWDTLKSQLEPVFAQLNNITEEQAKIVNDTWTKTLEGLNLSQH
ncbi:hypothetical protein ACWXVT_02280 [Mycoplasma sp. 1573]